jgi:hypothetical protein
MFAAAELARDRSAFTKFSPRAGRIRARIDGALRSFRHSIEIGKLGDNELLGKHFDVYRDQMMNIAI